MSDKRQGTSPLPDFSYSYSYPYSYSSHQGTKVRGERDVWEKFKFESNGLLPESFKQAKVDLD